MAYINIYIQYILYIQYIYSRSKHCSAMFPEFTGRVYLCLICQKVTRVITVMIPSVKQSLSDIASA